MSLRARLVIAFCSLVAVAGCGDSNDGTPSDSQITSVDQAVLWSSNAKTVKVPKPPKVKCEGKPKAKNAGDACGVCGQTIQCDASCGGVGVPAEYGQECGCGNTWQCDGTCGGGPAIPAEYNQPCGCGGTVTCDGLCSIPCPL